MINGIEESRTASLVGAANAKMSQAQAEELRESFLQVLTTQLQNQDPLNPMENAELTSQMAQISMVSGIEKLNQTVELLMGQIDASQALQASSLVGKGVLIEGDKILLEQNDEGEAFTTPLGIELDRPAENVTVTITAPNGEVINSYDLGSVSSGVHSFTWDGLTSDGETAASGAYTFSFEATDADGEPVAAQTLNYAPVMGVTPRDENGEVRLDLGGVYGQVSLADIRMII